MKNLFIIIALVFGFGFCFTSCEDETPREIIISEVNAICKKIDKKFTDFETIRGELEFRGVHVESIEDRTKKYGYTDVNKSAYAFDAQYKKYDEVFCLSIGRLYEDDQYLSVIFFGFPN